MTITQAIELVDGLTPNQYEWEEKVRWLSELDGIAYTEVILTHEWPERERPERAEFLGKTPGRCERLMHPRRGWRPYTPDTDPDGTVLLIAPPYDEVYRWYLDMKIAETNGEADRYNASAASYNQYYTAWAGWVNRNFMPRQAATHFKL